MRTLVVYQSKYGSTKQYATWISERLSADLRHVREVEVRTLDAYDTIVFGSYLHVGKIVDIDFVLKNWPILSKKRFALFTVSAAPPESADVGSAYEKNIPEDIRKSLRYFPLWGRVAKLDIVDRLLISFPKTILYIQYALTRDKKYKRMADGMRDMDHVKIENIKEIIDHLKN
jgi:menaquinone-dependent protoporphyrinogen IX oxidase